MILKFKKIILLVFYFLCPLILIYLYFSGNWYAITDSWSLAMICGLIAASFLFNQFILSARLKILDRVFGLDKILKFHGTITIAAYLLIIFHFILKLQLFFDFNIQIYMGITAISIFFLVILITVLLMVKTYTEPVNMFKRLSTFILKKTGLQYQSLRFFHNLTFIAVIIMTVHIILASSTQENNVRIYFILCWLGIVISLYIKNKLIKPIILKKRYFTVTENKKENENVITLNMRVPPESKFKYKPGQFAYFKFLNGNPGREEHPFSFSKPAGGEVSITIKKTGDWTGNIDTVKVGDKVAVDGPYGVFSYTRVKKDKELCFIAGGIGITPFLSMLRDIIKRHIIFKNIKLIWQVSKISDLINKDEITGYEQKIDNFKFIPIVSKDENWNGISGRLNMEKLNQIGINRNTDYFICAPYSMMKETIKNLKMAGIKKRSIHFEYFNM